MGTGSAKGIANDMNRLFQLAGAMQHDPEVEEWLGGCEGELGELARKWFSQIRRSGDDVLELIHDSCPVACVADLPFAYVNVFRSHVNVGFFQGADLPDPSSLLQGTGKRMRHVKLRPSADQRDEALSALIAAAYDNISATLGGDQMNRPVPVDVKQVIESYPPAIRKKIYGLRGLIYRTAAATQGVGRLTETLKWGEPAYLTQASKSGSTIRIGWKQSAPAQYAIYLNCQTTLVDTCRTRFPELNYEGNRAIVFSEADELPEEAICECIEMALVYHQNKKSNQNTSSQSRNKQSRSQPNRSKQKKRQASQVKGNAS